LVKKIIIIIIIFILFTATITLLSQESKEIEKYQSELFKIGQEINVLKEKLKREKEKELTLLSQLRTIKLERDLLRKEINFYELKLKQTEIKIKNIRIKIKRIKKELEKKKEILKNVLVSLYKLGKFRYFQIILSAKDLNSLISGSKYISELIKLQSKAVEDYRKSLEKLKRSEEELRKKNEELTTLKKKAEQKRKDLRKKEVKNKLLLQKIQEDKTYYTKALKELTAQAEKLKEIIKNLTKKEEVFPFIFPPIYEKRGSLNWPVEGKIITYFGLQKHPVFKTTILNKGIEISPYRPHSIIRAVYYGRVVFAEYFEGYGNLIIIDHGLKYYSLYGYCSEFLVNKGDFVRENQAIAFVGDTGSLKGECLYFELRYRTKPLNPLKWLKKR
jgi:septal ring factor EnvC (AmiA/AmiB activator)